MRIAPDAQVGEVVQRLLRALGGDGPLEREAPQNVDDLDVQDMRRMDALAGKAEPRRDGLEGADPQDEGDGGRRVENDQDASR